MPSQKVWLVLMCWTSHGDSAGQGNLAGEEGLTGQWDMARHLAGHAFSMTFARHGGSSFDDAGVSGALSEAFGRHLGCPMTSKIGSVRAKLSSRGTQEPPSCGQEARWRPKIETKRLQV